MNSNVSASERDSFILHLIGFDFWLTAGILYALMACVVIIVNPVAIFFIGRHRVLHRSPTNIFMLCACCADTVYGFSIWGYALSPVMAMSPSLPDPSWSLLRVTTIAITTGVVVSQLTNFYISVERGIATFRPLQYKTWVTSKRAIVVIVLTWVYVLVLLPLLAFIHLIDAHEYAKHTIVPTFDDTFGATVYQTYISGHLYFPLSASVIVYAAIAVKLFKQSKDTGTNTIAPSAQKHSVKVTKVSMMLLMLMILTMLPASFVNLFFPIPADPIGESEAYRPNKMAIIIAGLPMLSYSFINIIFYAHNHRDFRALIASKLLKRNQVSTVSGEQLTGAADGNFMG